MMAWIRTVGEGEATGELRAIYEGSRRRAGSVANVVRLMSLEPSVAAGSMQFYVSLMKSRNALEAPRREMLATVVSLVNDCFY